MVGAAEFRRVAPTILAIPPSLASVASMSSGSRGVPRASDSSSRKDRTVLVTLTGHLCRPSRLTASQSSVMALSLLVIEPCPAVPSTVSRIQCMPFCAVSTR